jgi:hypothetical protein
MFCMDTHYTQYNNSGKNEARIFQFCMKVPYYKQRFSMCMADLGQFKKKSHVIFEISVGNISFQCHATLS